MNDQLNETLLGWINAVNGPLWDFLVVFLVAVGIFYTIMTGAVQIRLFWHSMKVMKGRQAGSGWVMSPVWPLPLRLADRARCSGCGLLWPRVLHYSGSKTEMARDCLCNCIDHDLWFCV